MRIARQLLLYGLLPFVAAGWMRTCLHLLPQCAAFSRTVYSAEPPLPSR